MAQEGQAQPKPNHLSSARRHEADLHKAALTAGAPPVPRGYYWHKMDDGGFGLWRDLGAGDHGGLKTRYVGTLENGQWEPAFGEIFNPIEPGQGSGPTSGPPVKQPEPPAPVAIPGLGGPFPASPLAWTAQPDSVPILASLAKPVKLETALPVVESPLATEPDSEPEPVTENVLPTAKPAVANIAEPEPETSGKTNSANVGKKR